MWALLATGIYIECAFDRLPILVDALDEVGGNITDILSHSRSEGPYVRGYWAVDLVLDKRPERIQPYLFRHLMATIHLPMQKRSPQCVACKECTISGDFCWFGAIEGVTVLPILPRAPRIPFQFPSGERFPDFQRFQCSGRAILRGL